MRQLDIMLIVLCLLIASVVEILPQFFVTLIQVCFFIFGVFYSKPVLSKLSNINAA